MNINVQCTMTVRLETVPPKDGLSYHRTEKVYFAAITALSWTAYKRLVIICTSIDEYIDNTAIGVPPTGGLS